MSTIGDLCVTTSVSSDDKLPIWQTCNGVTRALPISVLDDRYLSQDDIAALAASAKVETFISGIGFTPGVSLSLTLANQYFSAANIEVFFDALFQGPDQYSLVGFGLVFNSPIPVGVQRVYVRGGATRVTGAPSDGTVTDSSVASGTKLYNRIHDFVSVKDFGACGDGVTDDTRSIQNAINAVVLKGGTLYFPSGNYIVSGNGLTIDQTSLTQDQQLTRISLVGAGKGNTQITYIGSNCAIAYAGSTSGGGIQGYFTIEKMRLEGNGTGSGGGTTANGLSINNCGNFAVRDFLAHNFNYGCLAYDILIGIFDSCSFINNQNGFVSQYKDYSDPNALTFLDCDISGNQVIGVLLGDPTTCTFVGGTIEYNGLGTSSPVGGVQIVSNNNVGMNGAFGASFQGVYFEGNAPSADIWFTVGNGTGGPSAMMVQGCTFNRVTSTAGQFATNNIRMDVAPSNKAILSVIGNGFSGFNSYSESAGRPYVAVNDSGGSSYDVVDIGNLYHAGVAKPVYSGPAKTGLAMASAHCFFNGSSSVVLANALNISSIVRNSVGNYTINFQKAGPNTAYPVTVTLNGIGFAAVVSQTTSSVTVNTWNASSTLTDFTGINVTVFANGDVT
jgi:hypothetical protein